MARRHPIRSFRLPDSFFFAAGLADVVAVSLGASTTGCGDIKNAGASAPGEAGADGGGLATEAGSAEAGLGDAGAADGGGADASGSDPTQGPGPHGSLPSG